MSPVPDKPNADPPPADDAHMTLGEHLTELRRRLIVGLAAVVLAALAAGAFVPAIMRLIRTPLDRADEQLVAVRENFLLQHYEKRIAGVIADGKRQLDASVSPAEREIILRKIGERATRERARYEGNRARRVRSELRATSPLESFKLVVTLAVICGILIASPVWIVQAWAFIAPGLYPREKKVIVLILTAGLALFAVGVVFAYLFVVPIALNYLIWLAGKMGLVTDFNVNDYMNFVVMILIAFGLVFESPLVVAALSRAGLVTPAMLTKNWRYFIVGAFVFGAVLTPPDVLTQIVMATVILALYLVSIGVATIMYARHVRSVKAHADHPATRMSDRRNGV